MKIEQLQSLAHKNVLLPIAAGAVAVVLLIRLVYLPLGALLGARRAALQDLMVRIADTRMLASHIPQQEKALQDAEKRFQALKSRIGQGQSVARILDVLSQQAQDRRIELVAVQGRQDNNQARVLTWGGVTLREVPLTLQLTGRYRQLAEFLGMLSDAPFVTAVRTLKFTRPQADSPKLQADLVLGVYLAERSMPQ